MLTRKHFELVADEILATRRIAEEDQLNPQATLDVLTRKLATAFAGENPAFSSGRFFNATGFGQKWGEPLEDEEYNEPNEPYPGAWV